MRTFKRSAFTISCIGIALVLFFSSCTMVKKDGNYQKISHDSNYHWQMGTAYFKNGSYEKAEHEFKQVLEDNPRNSNAHYKLGVVYNRQGLIKKSCNEFLTVISIDENYTKAYYNLAALYSMKGPFYNVEKAEILFNTYLELEPNSKHRKKIEHWLAQDEEQEKIISDKKSELKTSRNPSQANYKKWLEEQSGMIGEKE